MPPKGPIDPLAGPKLALRGRVVTMDAKFKVVVEGVVFLEKGVIAAVQPATKAAPPGFENVTIVDVEGTIYPGLIELHNHLSYNILPLWQVSRRYDNRDQWGRVSEYQKLVTGPMKVVGRTLELLPALTRYVEAKCLLGGVTTSQGIALASNAGARRFYRGIVRNVEQTGDSDLPQAATHILDIEAKDAKAFEAMLKRETTELLHLSEGTNDAARDHFLALKLAGKTWALDDGLVGIHCVALKRADFDVMTDFQSAMVWSPLSNLLLYGATADVKAARAAGIRIGIGSDWSPSGSKNLLGELKIAHLHSEANGGLFSERDFVAMATREAAAIIKWDRALGTLEKAKRADLLVLDGISADPYHQLIAAKETDIRLVMINGVARYGTRPLMKSLGAEGEAITVGGKRRSVYLEQATQDDAVAAMGLMAAKQQLAQTLRDLPKLARQLATKKPRPAPALRAGPEPLVWSLALDELGGTGVELRPRLSMPGQRATTGPSLTLGAQLASQPLDQIVTSMSLDPLTVVDDDHFVENLAVAKNLPDNVKSAIRSAF